MSKRRGLQKRVAEAFAPLGFQGVSGAAFIRQAGQQIHFVGLQYRSSSSEITFNLGCHFQGVPSNWDYAPKSPADLLDFGLRCRIGDYIGDGFYDVWWSPGNNEVPAVLAQASWAIDRAFADCEKKWGNDGGFLFQKHVRKSGGDIRLSRPLSRWMLAQREFEKFGFLTMLAHQRGEESLTAELYERAISCKHSSWEIDGLTKALGRIKGDGSLY